MSAMASFRQLLGAAPSRQVGSVLVVGLGRFGTAVARTLVSLDIDVVAVDHDRALVDRWADELPSCRQIDATDPVALDQIGAGGFDVAVVAIGDNIEASILAAAGLVDAGCPVVWAKAITDEHGRILERIGTHHVIFPERQMGERVAHVLMGSVVDYFQLADGFVIAELRPPAWAVDRSLQELAIRQRFDVTVVCVKPDGRPFANATADTVVGRGDLLVVAGQQEDVDRFADEVAGDPVR